MTHWKVGDQVRTPDGVKAVVTAVDLPEGFIEVHFGAAAFGQYPPDKLLLDLDTEEGGDAP